MTSTFCDDVRHGLGSLFSCSPLNDYLRVRTPLLYPDGDVIDLFVKEADGVITVSDLGETLRWLRTQSLSPKRSPKQQKMLEDVCLNHGLELFRGMLQARVKGNESPASVVMRTAQGALRAADIWFTMRTRSVKSMSDEVETFLSERHVLFERGQPLVGRSGRTWRPDFYTRMPTQSSLVFVLSTGSRAAAHGVADRVHTACYDLSNLHVGPESLHFVSLFDDTLDVWANEDFQLLEELSLIARWTQPDVFLQALGT